MKGSVTVFAIRPNATDDELLAMSEGLTRLWPSALSRVHRRQDVKWRFSGRVVHGQRR